MNNLKKSLQIYTKDWFEAEAWKNNSLVCGIDEAGRGPLFGPLVFGCVILPINSSFYLLKDSKKLSEQQRSKAFDWIRENCIFEYVQIDNWLIDEINVNKASEFAIKKILNQILSYNINIKTILVDHVKISFNSYKDIQIITAPKGEDWSSSIAAASIVAKETRDNLILKMQSIFPAFSLKTHKGYTTQKHIQEIQSLKTSIFHRKKYCDTLQKNLHSKEQISNQNEML